MKNRIFVILAVAIFMLLGCKSYAPYETKNISLDVQLLDVSAGYARVKITPSKDTYYYVGMIELDSGQTSPAQDASHFMTLQLDQANIDYLNWRHDLLEKNVPYVASFVDHVLYYGTLEHTLVHLIPGRNYMLFAFVVDPITITPVGELFYKTFVTTDSSYKDIYFDYRIDDWWDFVYPVDSAGEINSYHPYMVSTVTQDSLLAHFLNDTVDALHKPYCYFWLFLGAHNYILLDYGRIEYGVYSASHKDAELAPDSVTFNPGTTYYTCIFSADGMVNQKQFQSYKFTWQPGMKQTFSHLTDDVGTHW